LSIYEAKIKLRSVRILQVRGRLIHSALNVSQKPKYYTIMFFRKNLRFKAQSSFLKLNADKTEVLLVGPISNRETVVNS